MLVTFKPKTHESKKLKQEDRMKKLLIQINKAIVRMTQQENSRQGLMNIQKVLVLSNPHFESFQLRAILSSSKPAIEACSFFNIDSIDV